MSKRSSTTHGHSSAKRSRKSSEDDVDKDVDFSQYDPPSPGKGKEAEFGIIEHISMKNFMCHDQLEFDFGSHINYLIGRNGSGKSAVLTALVVGLGGKASSTSRGNSIKNFIKEGKNKAWVTVKLRNRGTDAFKHDDYGESIVVERHFSMDGASHYKLRSHDGRVVSTKRDELTHILDQFNIQVDNPVAILNQETSKSFLSSGRPADYYRFFLKATQLEQMQMDYMEAHEQRKVTMNIVGEKTRLLPQLEDEVAKLEVKFKAIMSLDDLRDKVANLKKDLAWAFVVAEEKQLGPMVKALETEESRTHRFDAKIQESKEKLEKVMKEKEEIHQNLQTMSAEVKTIQPLHDQAKLNMVEKKKKHREAVMGMRRVEHDMKSQVNDKNQMVERIEEIRASTQNNEHELEERERKIKKLADDIESLKEQRATRELDMERFQSAAARDRNEIRQYRNEERELQSQIQDLQRRMNDLEGSKNNNLARYGRWMPQLLQRIEEAHKRGRFHKKPCGPIGANMHPTDPQWALAIETALKRLIRSFCCHDHHDEKVLEQIMRECNIPNKPDTIVSAFVRARGEYPTMFDMLEIKDPVIANCLIDQRRIENVILIEDKIVARQVMEKSPPPNARECFTPNGDQLFHSPSFKIYSSNNHRSEFLSVNVERDLGQFREQGQALTRQLQVCQQKIADKQREIVRNEAEEKKVERLLRQSRDSVNKWTLEMQELQNIEDPAPADIIALEEEVEKYDQNIETLDAAMKKEKKATEMAKRELDEANEEMKKRDKQMKDISDNGEPLRERLTDVEFRIVSAKEEKKHYDGKMKVHQANLKERADRIAAFKVDISEKVKMASDICERVDVNRSPRDLESEIIQIQKQIETEERTQGDKKQIVDQYHNKSEAYKAIKAEVRRFTVFLERLKRAMNERQLAFADMRRMIAIRTRYIFITMLSSRHYMGKLIFDHKKETLAVSFREWIRESRFSTSVSEANEKQLSEIYSAFFVRKPSNPTVQPTVSVSGQGSKDMRALSGGERSFSTVCFMLSLWQAMDSPFRCLDEFDVFMDMVNRRVSMEMMMRAAESQPNNQFIFLTPLDITSALNLSVDVRIYRMPDPEREVGEAAVAEEEDDR